MKFKTVVYICQGHADMIYAFDEKIMIHRKIAKDWFKCQAMDDNIGCRHDAEYQTTITIENAPRYSFNLRP